MKAIDEIHSGNLNNRVKGQRIFENLPWSRHVKGFCLSRFIGKEFGEEELIRVQYSSIDFIRVYENASIANEWYHVFSEKAIDHLNTIQ